MEGEGLRSCGAVEGGIRGPVSAGTRWVQNVMLRKPTQPELHPERQVASAVGV